MSKAYGAKNKTVCEAYEKCMACNSSLNPPDRRKHSSPHQCYASFCKNCKSFVLRDHLCCITCGEAAKHFGKRPKKRSTGKDVDLGSEDFEEDSDADNCDEPDETETMEVQHVNHKYRGLKFVSNFECGSDASRYQYPNMAALMCMDDDSIQKVFRGK